MQWEQLSFLTPDFFSRSELFDPISNYEGDTSSENIDTALPINHIQAIAEVWKILTAKK
jgi:hypothetical protein